MGSQSSRLSEKNITQTIFVKLKEMQVTTTIFHEMIVIGISPIIVTVSPIAQDRNWAGHTGKLRFGMLRFQLCDIS